MPRLLNFPNLSILKHKKVTPAIFILTSLYTQVLENSVANHTEKSLCPGKKIEENESLINPFSGTTFYKILHLLFTFKAKFVKSLVTFFT